MNINPRRILGFWDDGFSLDVHTTDSVLLGHDEFGHPEFDTRRTELGERLYQLKYRGDRSAVASLAEVAAGFVRSWNPGVNIIVPVPPSRHRQFQPLLAVAEHLAKRLDLPFDATSVQKVKKVPELKGVFDLSKRTELLAGAHDLQGATFQDRRVLLFDDLFRSGATMNAIAKLLRSVGGAAAVFALTLTRTRTAL